MISLKQYIFESRIPEDVELSNIDYSALTLNDISIIDLGGNGIDVAFLGVEIKGDYNKGIVIDIKVINDLYTVDILLAPQLQRRGLGLLSLNKVVYEFGHIVHKKSGIVNDIEIPKIINKQKTVKDFDVFENDFGYLVLLKSNPDYSEILDKFNNSL